MRNTFLLLAALAGAAFGSGAQASELGPIAGAWRTQVDRGEVRFEACGDKICGRLITSDRLKAFPDQLDVHNHDKALRARPLKGALIAQGFSGGPTAFSGGTVYDPAGGGTYSGRIALTGPDKLRLTGCIVPPLCRSQTWTRIGRD